MKVGIIGPAERAAAWEEHLAGHSSVSEAVIAGNIEKAGSADACLLLKDEEDKLDKAIATVKQGIHTFLISKLPVGDSDIKKLYYAAEEANVRIQFSHWPTLAPASQFTAMKIPKPSFIQIVRRVSHSAFLENDISHRFLVMDELAYCLKCVNSSVHQISYSSSVQDGKATASHALIQFDSGATAAVYINTAAEDNRHTRFVSDSNLIAECEVRPQHVRLGHRTEGGPLFFDRKEFDATEAAQQAVTKFLKAIQLKNPTLYNGYDLVRLNNMIDKIDNKVL